MAGATMIEVLVTMVIIAFGLLGIAGLQVRLQSSEVEAYQRTQALLLLNDLKWRIEANRLQSAKYAEEAPITAPVGAGVTCADLSNTTMAEKDLVQWCDALQGAGEVAGANRAGAMIGGRGCVEDLTPVPSAVGQVVRVTVAWQGLTPLAAPAETCGANLYDGPGCEGDRCRRTVSTLVRLANLK